jgi:glycosyltransferase involved in cell wall biosynthesis
MGALPCILFVDPVSPFNYTGQTSASGKIPGTERMVTRLAEALSEHCDVVVTSSLRSELELVRRVTYAPLEALGDHDPIAVVALREPSVLPTLRALFPRARLLLWLHDWRWSRCPKHARSRIRRWILSTRARVICASAAHLENVRWSWVQEDDWHVALPLAESFGYVYHGVPDDLRPDGTPFDPNKLVFFSSSWSPAPPELASPTARLDEVLRALTLVRRRIPDMTLYYAYPEHNPAHAALVDEKLRRRRNVVNLGSLTIDEVMQHLRSALCYFYPNRVCPEAFGLVMAESNGVGTPVLTHPIGAAPEVLGPGEQLIDCFVPERIVSAIDSWRSGARPRVFLRDTLRVAAMVRSWGSLLGVELQRPSDQTSCRAAIARPASLAPNR